MYPLIEVPLVEFFSPFIPVIPGTKATNHEEFWSLLSNAAILKIVINMNNLKMHFKIEMLTQNFLSNGMETVALAFGSVAD